ncbi:hypothetical protein OIU77_030584 [Salix suchowensis]|uniref:Uncharacterized protein n=1 Tax=Salix suchowensis TaxID=1278906 RepID=A0ABQ9BEL4_9ROSI|nr:hypothetical protein OIU77_030584 [Salix suchowensis]
MHVIPSICFLKSNRSVNGAQEELSHLLDPCRSLSETTGHSTTATISLAAPES